MTESIVEQIASLKAQSARIQAQIARLEAQHPQPPQPRASNIVEDSRVVITVGDDIRSGDLPNEVEVDQLMGIVARAGQLASTLDRGNFVDAIRFLGSVGRTEEVNMKISAYQWALLGEEFMSQLGRSVTFTNGSLWAASIACGTPAQLGYQDRGIPARLGLAWDSSLPRAHSRWRQILAQGKILPFVAARLDPLSPAAVRIGG